MKHCPVCDGPSAKLGKLGSLTWYRCTCCGMQHFTRPNVPSHSATKTRATR